MGDFDKFIYKIVKVRSTSPNFKRGEGPVFGRLYPETWIEKYAERGYTLRVIVSAKDYSDCYLTPSTIKDANVEMIEATADERRTLLRGLEDMSLYCSEGCWMIEALKISLSTNV